MDVKLFSGNIGNFVIFDMIVKINIVVVINEFKGFVDGLSVGVVGIDDNVGNGDIIVIWFVDKIYDMIELVKVVVIN